MNGSQQASNPSNDQAKEVADTGVQASDKEMVPEPAKPEAKRDESPEFKDFVFQKNSEEIDVSEDHLSMQAQRDSEEIMSNTSLDHLWSLSTFRPICAKKTNNNKFKKESEISRMPDAVPKAVGSTDKIINQMIEEHILGNFNKLQMHLSQIDHSSKFNDGLNL